MFLGSKTFSGAIKSIYFTIVDLIRYSDSGIPNSPPDNDSKIKGNCE